jgi:hypothetical protein
VDGLSDSSNYPKSGNAYSALVATLCASVASAAVAAMGIAFVLVGRDRV